MQTRSILTLDPAFLAYLNERVRAHEAGTVPVIRLTGRSDEEVLDILMGRRAAIQCETHEQTMTYLALCNQRARHRRWSHEVEEVIAMRDAAEAGEARTVDVTDMEEADLRRVIRADQATDPADAPDAS